MKKPTTTWQRLNTGLAILIGLLLVGFGLAWWIEHTRSKTAERTLKLLLDRERIDSGLAKMHNAVLRLLINPTNTYEITRRQDAENDTLTILSLFQKDTYQKEFSQWPSVLQACSNLFQFTRQVLVPNQRRAVELATNDQVQAIADYQKTYPAILEQRDRLLTAFSLEVYQFKKTETAQTQNQVLLGNGLICIVAILSALVVKVQSSVVSRPLTTLVGALEQMSSGDFTQRLSLEREDDFGVVGSGLNRLADDLSGLVGQVQRSCIQVNTAATEIGATAREQQSTATQIAATTAEIGATSKEISATSNELVRTMNEVSEVAEETAKLAGSGQSAIGRMESTMRQIMEAAGSITAKLAVLNEKTTNINSVVTTITKVADQTNLLSLNAAIEAEKAGEYGLGFAVVAVEIRRLADQTAIATYDIEKMVKEMQSAVAAGVMGMDNFSEEVRRGVEEMRQVSTQLAQIIQQVQTLTPRFQTVNEGMHAQATGAVQISDTLTQLSDSAHQTAESLRQFNLTIGHLNDAARGLQTSVARFKLAS